MDFEDFPEPRSAMPPQMKDELEGVVRVLAENRWPWRMHATYDETISRAAACASIRSAIASTAIAWLSAGRFQRA